MANSFLEKALAYHHAGLCILPAILNEKRPDVAHWKQYQETRPSESQTRQWFSRPRPMCLVTGASSGNVEMIDFDQRAGLYGAWTMLVEAEAPGLLARLMIESSQSGGKHVAYRCHSAVPGNTKLAERLVIAPDNEPMELCGKEYRPVRRNNRWEILVTLIETRGEGGVFLCSPTTGYVLEQGSLDTLPVLTVAEREILIEAALALNEVIPPPVQTKSAGHADLGRPGDDFNQRGDVREILMRHGWQLARGGENEYWRRPGKNAGWSATLKNGVFYVFTTNAAPFEAVQAYGPFAVFALLEHAGDFSSAARALREQGYGATEDHSGVIFPQFPTEASPPSIPDPGPIPERLFRVPGFISEIMDHCLQTAPYPNVALAFCGALALQATLAGRKVRDQADNRTNLYLLALAYSSVGKDWSRKVNTMVLHRVGLVHSLGEKFASGEGIQDSLFRTPVMLFQTDEIDGLLQSINKAQDARHENILGTLLTMYSTANGIYPMRRKAGKEPAGIIDQPCLVIYGTAIPTHYYGALSERLLTNGFFARMLIVESGPRNAGQEPGIIDPPSRVLETARAWTEFCPGTGNLDRFHPEPKIVDASATARRIIQETRTASEFEYTQAETSGDPVGTTVWGRVPEHARKLALIYAVSENHDEPMIGDAAAQWASDFVLHQTRRMLFMASNHVAANGFHAECLKLMRKLREVPGQRLSHSMLLKRMKIDAKTFGDIVTTLHQQGDLNITSYKTEGRDLRIYELRDEVKEGDRGERSQPKTA